MGHTDTLDDALAYCCTVVGLRGSNYPSKVELMMMVNHIQKYYGGHTPAEVRLAFEMAVAGKLNLKSDEIHPYENFSIEYFSKIMNAYRHWAVMTDNFFESQEQKVQKTYPDFYLNCLLSMSYVQMRQKFFIKPPLTWIIHSGILSDIYDAVFIYLPEKKQKQ